MHGKSRPNMTLCHAMLGVIVYIEALFGSSLTACCQPEVAAGQFSKATCRDLKVVAAQEIDVERKHALCRAQIAYEDGRRPQFEVGTLVFLVMAP